MARESVVVSGDWLLTEEAEKAGSISGIATPYRVGYKAQVDHSECWSGGCAVHLTRDAIVQLVQAQVAVVEEFGVDNAETLDFASDVLLVTFDGETREVYPDLDGLYHAPSWSWYTVEASECVEIIG